MKDEPKHQGMWTRRRKLPTLLVMIGLVAVALLLESVLFLKLVSPPMREQLRFLNLSVALAFMFVATFLAGVILFIALMVPAGWRQRLFNRQLLRRSLFCLACGLTLVALFYVFENWRGQRAWNQYVREVAARGEPSRLEALIPPPIPDDQNFALAPLLKPVLDFEYRLVPAPHSDAGEIRQLVWRDTNGLQRLERLSPRWLGSDLVQPNNPGATTNDRRETIRHASDELDRNPLTNGWINLAAWQRYYAAVTNLSGESPAADVLAALAYVDGDLAGLKHEGAQRPLARWPILYDLDSPWGILLPHLTREKQLCELIQLRAAAQLALGRVESALSEIDLGFRLADSSGNEPFLISHLVRLACYELLLQPIREGIARHQFSEAQLVALQARLQGVDLLASFRRGILGERAANASWIDITDEVIGQFAGNTGDEFASPMFRYAVFARMVPEGWIYQNQLTICRYFDSHILPVVDVEAHRVHASRSRAIGSELPQGPFAFLLNSSYRSSWIFGEFHSWPRKFAHGQTQIDQTVIACALERYRLAHGEYPKHLNALSPQFIASVPHDLVTGEAMRYRTTQDARFILHSVGWNETDEQGEIVLDHDGKEDPENGDWVWELPAAPSA